jgi:hypothetical protein
MKTEISRWFTNETLRSYHNGFPKSGNTVTGTLHAKIQIDGRKLNRLKKELDTGMPCLHCWENDGDLIHNGLKNSVVIPRTQAAVTALVKSYGGEVLSWDASYNKYWGEFIL